MIWTPDKRIVTPRKRQGGFLVNPFRFGHSDFSWSGWNPSDKGVGITLSNDDFRAAGGPTAYCVRAVTGKTSGKYYFEFVADDLGAVGSAYGVGVSRSSESVNGFLGDTAFGWGLYESGFLYNSGSSTPSGLGAAPTGAQVHGVAVDLDAGQIWFSRGGVWIGSPEAGSGSSYNTLSGMVFPTAWLGSTIVDIRTDPSDFSFSSPSGFTSGWPD